MKVYKSMTMIKNITQGVFISILLNCFLIANDKQFSSKLTPIMIDNSILIFVPYEKLDRQTMSLNKLKAYADDNQNPVPTVKDYQNININTVTALNIVRINSVLASKSVDEVDTIEKITLLVDRENKNIAIEHIEDYAKDGSITTAPTFLDYTYAGLRCVDQKKVEKINNTIKNTNDTIWDVQQVINKSNGMESILLDNDAFDPDWVIMLTATLGLAEQCEANVAGIVLTGRDINAKQGMLYSSILYYYDRSDIPLGLNGKQIMRTYSIRATQEDPTHINYKGTFSSIDDFPSDQCIDYEWCWGRNEATDMLCTILSESDEKITWVVGGHMHNVANLLNETEVCNGKELISKKIKQIVISTGWEDRTKADPEMNLSEGTSKPNSAIEATKYVFRNRPNNVPIILASVPNSRTHQSRVGDVFLNNKYNNSPMSYILSVPTYGIYGDHGLSDTEALMYAVRNGISKNNITYTQKVKTCFNLHNNGAITIGNNCVKEDYYLEKTISNYADVLSTEVEKLISSMPLKK